MLRWRLKLLSAGVVLSLAFAIVPVISPTVSAQNPKEEICKGSGGTWSNNSCTQPTGTNTDLPGLIRNVVNILLFIIGAVAVIMIVIGGIKYTTSNGDQGSVKSAKDTILYSVVGIIVAFMAYAIVNFVISRL